MRSAVDLVRGFRRLRALVIGDAMLDSYLEGSAARLCTEGPVPVVRKTTEEQVPGGAANTAANLRALGAEVVFLGLVGRDVAGTLLRDALQAAGVDDRWLVEDESINTLNKVRILADDQYVVRFDSGDTRRHTQAARNRLLAHLTEAFPLCDLVVISDYRYGTVSDELLAHLRALRVTRFCPLVIDSKDIRRFRTAGATVVTPNHLEARLAAEPGSADDGSADRDDVERIGRLLLDAIDARHAAITMGAEGVLVVSRDGESSYVPAHPVAHANDVGAGDSFTASLALALASGADVAEAARIGVDAGGIAVTKRRTAVVQHQELLQRVSLAEQAEAPTASALSVRLERDRRLGKTIVFTNGVFDILHAGHVHFLRQAKSLGDVLVVGVNSDQSARRLKGKNRPINSERDRLALVAALDSVDHVAVFDEDTPTALIRALRPDIHVKGGDYAGEELPETQAVEEAGGRVVILPLVESLSTSGVIDRIVSLALDGRIGARA
jgi:D-beta-D-heptose 7-phosphate kinase / D-beta-D-heptose 1-phosphate adenosyltransferase